MTEETFLFLVAVVVSLILLTLYVSLISSVQKINEVSVYYYITQYNFTKELKNKLLFGVNKSLELPFESNYPRGDYEEYFPKENLCNENYYNINIYCTIGNCETYKKEFYKLKDWFHSLNFNINIISIPKKKLLTEYLNEIPKPDSCNTLNIVIVKKLKFEGTSFELIKLRDDLYVVSKESPLSPLRAFLDYFGCGVTFSSQCITTPFEFSLKKREFSMDGYFYGYVCKRCIIKILTSLTIATGEPQFYSGPSRDPELEYLRIKNNKIFVPGDYLCFFYTKYGYVLCSSYKCELVDNYYSVKFSFELPKEVIKKMQALCIAKYGNCEIKDCFYNGIWYKKSGNTFYVIKNNL